MPAAAVRPHSSSLFMALIYEFSLQVDLFKSYKLVASERG